MLSHPCTKSQPSERCCYWTVKDAVTYAATVLVLPLAVWICVVLCVLYCTVAGSVLIKAWC